ncbi:MAG: virulence factor family protein [Pseudomonadota bacterium]
MIRIRMFLFLLVLTNLGLGATAVRAAAPEALKTDEFGTAYLFRPEGTPTSFVYLVSDAHGWGPGWDAAGAALAAEGAAVLGIDWPSFQAALDRRDDTCIYPVSELENVARRLQRDLNVSQYLLPVLAGSGEGGSFVYLALEQAASVMFQGGVTIDATPALATKAPFCDLRPAPVEGQGGFRYAPQALKGWWRAASHDPNAPDLALMLAAAGADGEKVALPAGADAPSGLVALLAPKLAAPAAAAAAPATSGSISALGLESLVEVPAKGGGKPPYLAIVYSGDGGWRDLDRTIAGILADRGIPAIGVDCLQYFWHERTPEQVAGDLAGMIRRYREKWDADKVLLIGYSFGAGVLPFAYDRLPEAEKSAVVQISLLAPELRADFEVHMAGWFGAAPAETSPPLAPEMAKLDPKLVQCFYGEEEAKDSFCATPDAAKFEVIRTKGGHHFDGDYTALANRILEGAKKRGG